MPPTDWLKLAKGVVRDEIERPLREAGFVKRRDGFRPRGDRGPSPFLAMDWAPAGRRANVARVLVTVRGFERTDFALGDDDAQITFFLATGRDDLAAEILGPVGLLDAYRRRRDALIGAGLQPPSVTAAATRLRSEAERANARRAAGRLHRWRWSDPDALARILSRGRSSLLAYLGGDASAKTLAAVEGTLFGPRADGGGRST